MFTIRQVHKLIEQGDYGLSINLRDAYLDFSIAKHHCNFLHFVLQNKLYQWKILLFGLSTFTGFYITY